MPKHVFKNGILFTAWTPTLLFFFFTWYILISVILFQCYPAKALFESFSVDSDGLNPEKFEKICPALVEQIESKACVLDQKEEDKEDATQSKAQGLYPLQTQHPSLVILAPFRYSIHFLISETDCPNDFLDIKEETNILVILLNFCGSISPIFYSWRYFYKLNSFNKGSHFT